MRWSGPFVQVVSRLPATVHVKLLVAFVGTVVLLVVLGVLALRVLGESNDRVAALGTLQQKATAYEELQAHSTQVRQLLSVVSGGSDLSTYLSDPTYTSSGGSTVLLDSAISGTLTQVAPAIKGAVALGPTDSEQATLARIQNDDDQLVTLMGQIRSATADSSETQQLHKRAEALANEMGDLADSLVSDAKEATTQLIAQNQASFADSQRLFIAVALGSIVLAMLLGYVLSWSVVGPIRQIETRLVEIEAGDFSRHVTVRNRDELGTLAANINAMNDELGRLYSELAAASRHKSEFLANMSHELRTPLNAIIGFSQVLREQMFGELNDRQRGYLDDILTSGQHLLSLINDILDLAKVEAGRMELQTSQFSLPATLANAVTMVRERAARQQVSLATDIGGSIDVIEADERKVKQVLFNLLSNAVKFTPSGGRVTVTARNTEGGVEIAVADTGVGISPEEQARIFDEFYQVGPGKTQEGTGLGLALTRRLVELHGGRLSVESAPGAGSTFTFTLPNQLSPAAADVSQRSAPSPVRVS